MRREILDREEFLTRLFNETEALQDLESVDGDLKAQMIWYLCVRTAGFIEYAVQAILSDYFRSDSVHQPLGEFVSNDLLEPRRFSLMRVGGLIASFRNRQSVISEDYDLDKLESSIESIRTNRNSIAHGRDANQLTLMALDDYFEDARKLIRMVYEECNRPEVENST